MPGSTRPVRFDRPGHTAAPTASARRLGQGLAFLAALLAAGHARAGGLPDTIFTAVEPNPTSDTTGDFSFLSTIPGSTFQCNLDGAGFSVCSTPFTTPALANGPHTLLVRAREPGGGLDPTPAAHAWTVDTIAPNTTIDIGPSGVVARTSASFAFSSSEAGSTFQCSLDGAGFSSCPAGYTGLAQGSHTFQVRAFDAAGNVDPTPASRTWTVDTVAPNTTINSGPSGVVASTTATFAFSANEAGVTFQCALDGTAFAACPAGYTGLAQGSHTFQVRAVDAAGTPDPTPASRTWTVDTVAPDTSINTGPSGAVASTSATFTFSSNEAGTTFQCALDGAAFSSCPAGYTGLAQGSHTFQVRATDAAGNTDASPASRTWTVDTVAPDTSITSGPSGLVASTTATFTFSSNEAGATFECALDGAAFASCPVSFTGLAQGAHTLQVRARDAAGNVDPTPASRSWSVDSEAPDTTITSGPSGAVASTSATFTFTATEAGSTFQCALDGGGFSNCPAGFTGLAQGPHTFQVRAVDAVGNQDPTPATRTWTVDTVAPQTSFTATPTNPSTDPTGDFAFVSDEGNSGFRCSLDVAPFAGCTSPFTTPPLALGAHSLEVAAVDAAGNVDPSPATFIWSIQLDNVFRDGFE